jgi:glycosyltransferase involved in cell wall biosynthesis
VWLRRTVEGASRTGTDVFVAVSAAIAKGLVSAGVPADRVTVVHNGVDAEALGRAAAAGAPDGLPGTRPLVGCVARLERVKGVDLFVRAAAILSRQRPDVTFAVVGDGSQRAELETASRAESLEERVVFLGVVASAAPALVRFDVCVVPSRSEGLPMVVLEAMALARPVVATAVGGIPEAVDDGATGILVRPEDPEALAAAIGSLLDDPERGAAMGRAGRERVRAHFSADEQRRRYLEIFAGLLRDGA